MRFTRIPLIATLLAGALSLLVVLPAIAQSTLGVETDGRLSVAGALQVQVYDNITDIRARGIAAATTSFAATSANADAAPRSAPEGATTSTIARGDQALGLADTADDGASAFDYGRVPDPRNTYFGGNLYVSNDDDAYNTILITAQVPNSTSNSALRKNDDTGVTDDPETDVDEATDGWTGQLTGAEWDCVVAEARNTRSGRTSNVTLLAVGGTGDTAAAASSYVYQGVLTVWDRSTDRVEELNSVCNNDPVADPAIERDPDEDPWKSTEGTGTQPAAVIAARDGDTIEVTVEGIRGRLLLTVDGDAPTVTGLSPEDGGTTNSSRVTLGLTVSDDGAGLRFDSEDGSSGDGDSSPANGDNDQRFNEPLTIADSNPSTPTVWDSSPDATSTIQGATEDIQVYYVAGGTGVTDGTRDDTSDGEEHTLGHQPNVPAEEFSGYGTSGWTQVDFGRSYRLSMVLNSQAFSDYEWMVVARDRVGNSFTTDGDDDKSGPQPFTFTLDDENPIVNNVRTGVRFDASSSPPKEKADRSWIALTVVNEETTSDADRVERSSVDASDFTVSGSTVVEAFVPTSKKVCKANDPDTAANEAKDNVYDINGSGALANCDFEPRARIYLRLSEPLEADETPVVQMLGGVFRDVAGNPNEVRQLTGANVDDKIAPGVSVTVTASGEATNRPATNSKGEFTVRVTSDEDLRRFPTVYFAEIDGTDDNDDNVAEDLTVGSLDSITPTELERNVWERKIKADSGDLPGSGSRLIAVLVAAEDSEGNRGNSAGWTPTDAGAAEVGTDLDFKKLADGGYLIEIDNALAAPVAANVTVQPSVQGESKITESLTPYVEIKFEGEKNEYGIRGGGGPFYKADAGDDEDPIKTDSHEGVTLTKLTVDGEDRLADVRRVGSEKGRFILAFVEGLSLGKHEVVYAAKDDVGNEFSANSAGAKERSFSFTVRARAGYKVSIRPGWNLISLPGTPTNPAVSAVLEGLQANTALSYQNGEWLSALRGEDGEWQGTLEQIAGGYGYWIQTTAAETITTVIPPTLPNQVLPTVPITSGWNLVGVIDAGQRSAGTTSDPDTYFVNVSWRVAYGFDTAGSRWMKILPAPSSGDVGSNNEAIANGKGYWLWSTEPGTLVP